MICLRALSFAVILAGCHEPQHAPNEAANGPASASAQAISQCQEGASTCVDARSRKVCRGGAQVTEACSANALCIAQNCVALAATNGAPIAKERLRTLGNEGWFNGWSMVTPLAKKAVDTYLEHLDPATVGGEKAFHASCSKDGYVTPRSRPADKSEGPVMSVLGDVIISDTAKKVRVFASVSGKLRVLVGQKEVLAIEETHGIDKKPWVDERAVVVDLPMGPSDWTVVSEAPVDDQRLGGFYLRMRELDGSPLRGVMVGERFEPCPSLSLLDAGSELGVDTTGMFLHLDPIYRGMTPDSAKTGPFRIDVSASGRALGSQKLDGRGSVAIAVPERGGFEVSVHLEGSDGASDALFSRIMPAYGDLAKRVAKLMMGTEVAQKNGALAQGSRDSFEMHVRSLAKLLSQGDSDLPFIERHTKAAEKLFEQIERGEDPYASQTGVVYRAYRSALDGRLEPYVAFVPESQKRGKPQPLVLIYHGRDRLPEHALRTLIGEAPDDHMTLRFAERNMPAFPDQGAILVAPYGYDEGGPHPLGEDDLLRVVHEMESAYKVDSRRVSLTGYSLGGTVAFVVPLHHPDVFSAAAPLCGYPNLMSYGMIANAPHAPWEDALLAKKYVVNYADNGGSLPLNVVHGGLDGPGRSKVVIDRYKSLGYSYIFDVQDDLDHDVWDYAYEDGKMVGWLAGHARPLSPKHVRFVTGEYRYDRSYWVRLIGMKDAADAALASIDARLDEKTKHVEVSTAGVTALGLEREAMEPRATWSEGFSVTIDGDQLTVPGGASEVFLERTDHWQISEREPKREGLKRHGISGPLDDVLRHPITVVYGTRISQHLDANRAVAEHMAYAGGIAEVTYPILPDTEATEEALRDRSLVLIGSPSENAVTQKLAALLPIQFEPSAIVVRGTRFQGAGLGVSFIAPRPGVPSEYVVVHAGLDEEGILASRFLPRYLPDYVVYDSRVSVERGGLIFDQRPFVAGGFFSEKWD